MLQFSFNQYKSTFGTIDVIKESNSGEYVYNKTNKTYLEIHHSSSTRLNFNVRL